MHQGQLQDETFFGRIHFDRKNQNIGRLPITWQVLEDGNDRPFWGSESCDKILLEPKIIILQDLYFDINCILYC